jgi:uncharacterized protein (UPF0332 family)
MSDLWSKAQVAGRSATLLFASGDIDGAVNRAYYATFSAARTALAAIRPRLAASKRHGTIITRFAKYVVEERDFDRSLGRPFFSRQRSARHAADYRDSQVDQATAQAVIADAMKFLAATEAWLARLPAKRRVGPAA